MPFRFVHTADLHLDSPLRSLALRDPDLAELVAGASRHALRATIDLCLSEQVDALLIAGDLYDGSQTSLKTLRFLVAELARLDQAGIRTFIIRGNHDAASQISRELTLPPSAHLFGTRADVVQLDTGALRVAVHGLSLRDPKAPDSLLPQYQRPRADCVNIGLMHTSLNGAAGHDPYAPCALADLQGSGFTYWALGHIHKRAVYDGACTVVMPGIPQGRDIGEAGAGSVTLCTIGDDGRVHLQEHIVALASFARVAVDIDGLTDWADLRGAVHMALAAQPRATPHLIARLTLRGATPLAARLLRDRDLALAEAQEIARALGPVWVEKLELDQSARPPVAGALAELAALIDSDIRHSPALAAELATLRQQLDAALPPELRDHIGQVDLDGGLAQVLAQLGAQD
jgi:DNA repair exonuclease SbcCD nuclease subunit